MENQSLISSLTETRKTSDIYFYGVWHSSPLTRWHLAVDFNVLEPKINQILLDLIFRRHCRFLSVIGPCRSGCWGLTNDEELNNFNHESFIVYSCNRSLRGTLDLAVFSLEQHYFDKHLVSCSDTLTVASLIFLQVSLDLKSTQLFYSKPAEWSWGMLLGFGQMMM